MKRFWEKVNKNGPIPIGKPCRGKCWVWTGSTIHSGYGRFSTDDSYNKVAHRYIYEQTNGKIEKGLVVRHKCDNKLCVRLSHLCLGTQKDNVEDAMKRGTRGKSSYANRIGLKQGMSEDERFWRLVNKNTDCWEWIGALSGNGYGLFYPKGKPVRAHRFSYEKQNGKIPEGKIILHQCDNKKCVNPQHLRVGTHAENMKDAVKKGLLPDRTGCNLKLTKIQSVKIRKLYVNGMSTKKLAKQFKVNRITILDAVNGINYGLKPIVYKHRAGRKLTHKQIRAIRKLYRTIPNIVLAKRFGIHTRTVIYIGRRRTNNDIPD